MIASGNQFLNHVIEYRNSLIYGSVYTKQLISLLGTSGWNNKALTLKVILQRCLIYQSLYSCWITSTKLLFDHFHFLASNGYHLYDQTINWDSSQLLLIIFMYFSTRFYFFERGCPNSSLQRMIA